MNNLPFVFGALAFAALAFLPYAWNLVAVLACVVLAALSARMQKPL